ncbi:MAG: DegT/DnrJ/EryC1/StrS aminotransferase family protein [Planctomycetota bacterium]
MRHDMEAKKSPQAQPRPDSWPKWPPTDQSIRDAVRSVLEDGQWGQYHADIAKRLRDAISDRWQCQHPQLTCSGTAAIELAIRAAIPNHRATSTMPHRVVVAAYDYPGNLRTIELLGARPVVVDVHAQSPCLDVDQVARVGEAPWAESVVAVVASHLHGHVADMDALSRLCRQHGWILIEDACQSPGGLTADGRTLGSLGDIGCLSFGGSKPITAGNGGALLIHDGVVAARIDTMTQRPGDTYPLSPLQCAVILPQLHQLDERNRRRDVAARQIQSLNWNSMGCRPLEPFPEGGRLAVYKFPVLCDSSLQRDAIVRHWRASGVPVGEGFRSMHRLSNRRVDRVGTLENAERFGERLLLIDHRVLLDEHAAERLATMMRPFH